MTRSDCEIVEGLFLFKYLSQIANNLIIGEVSFGVTLNTPVITDLQFTSQFPTLHAPQSLLNQGLRDIFVTVHTDATNLYRLANNIIKFSPVTMNVFPSKDRYRSAPANNLFISRVHFLSSNSKKNLKTDVTRVQTYIKAEVQGCAFLLCFLQPLSL